MLLEVRIVGTVGKDAELKQTKTGKSVASFSVATKPNPKGETVWVKVTSWERQAELAGQYVKKGMKVMCTGTLQLDETGKPRLYTDGSGVVKASGVEMTAFSTLFLTKVDNGDTPTASATDLFSAGGPIDFGEDEEDTIPF